MVLHDKSKHMPREQKPWFKRNERQSGDVKSSINAPAKKNGQGGSYTWAGENHYDEGGNGTYEERPAVDQLNKNLLVKSSSGREPLSGMSSRSNSDAELLAGSFGFFYKAEDFPPLGGSANGAQGQPPSPMKRAQVSTWATNVMGDIDLKI